MFSKNIKDMNNLTSSVQAIRKEIQSWVKYLRQVAFA